MRDLTKGPREYGSLFVIYKDGTSDWLPVVTGKNDRVVRDTKKEASHIRQFARGREALRGCSFHNHFDKSPLVKGTVRYWPPSGEDIKLPTQMTALGSNLVDWRKNVLRGELFEAVTDRSGFWYYGPTPEHALADNPSARRKQQIDGMLVPMTTLEQEIVKDIEALGQEKLDRASALMPKQDSLFRTNAAGNIAFLLSFYKTDLAEHQELLDIIGPDIIRKLQPLREMSRSWHNLLDEQQKAEADAVKFIDAFHIQTVSANFDLQREEASLMKAYEVMQVTVRFVPNDKLKDEPPCAGPDYVPEKK